ncbi:hypothetical protein GCM10014715_89050 [Streptomyces spiralis]|uniref:Uncharacterized protein n=1 Tax=Streptomyces spiralis TaxID=66376 RepID=A0A919AQQ5_9ACTN|nr:hypothetical protein [Streptomyces spiralis]GHF20976.1 hypothetical protein GCM10014715_89050 [Streptomyces spiralis]
MTIHHNQPGDDSPWWEHVCARDVLRIIAAWDHLRLHIPASTRQPTVYLHQRTRLPLHLLRDLQQTRTVCAHPHIRPLTQSDLDRALVTAYHALARL